MTSLSLFVLSLTQAITEFIPVSSSGHLTLIQSWFGLVPSLGLDVFLNTATLVSVSLYFYPRLRALISWWLPLIVGSLPAALAALIFGDQIESAFSSTAILPYSFFLTSVFLFSTRFIKPSTKPLTLTRALIIGLFQAVAILPGVSRSGATIFAGLLVGLSPASAFQFSFGLFVPASLGAIFLKRDLLVALGLTPLQSFLSFALTAALGFLALRVLERVVTSHRLWIFGIYTFLLSLILFVIGKP
jgi:undecaprenyl-diphosphatase